MKKLVTILLAFVMIFAFAACAKDSESSESLESGSPMQSDAETSSENGGASVSSKESSGKSETSENSQNTNTSNPSSKTESETGSDKTDKMPEKTVVGTFSEQNTKPQSLKILVAYFSATNNTEGIAKKLAEAISADIYEITPEKPYTDADLDYGNKDSRSSVEMNDPSARPAISGKVANMDQYDVVLIGYPIWWGEAPRIMSTFIESYDFSGKTLAAFCTSASSGFGNSDSVLRSAAKTAVWREGIRFSTAASSDDLLAWVNGLRIG